MICKNCNSDIDDDNEYCPVCNVFVSTSRLNTMEVIPPCEYILQLDNGTKFIIDNNKPKIIVGRADMGVHPDIDLGPFDNGPYISRVHGYFTVDNACLYYENVGKNGTIISGRKYTDGRVKIDYGDIIEFANIKGVIR